MNKKVYYTDPNVASWGIKLDKNTTLKSEYIGEN